MILQDMNALDGDGGRLRDSAGTTATRDIVQFVPFSKYPPVSPQIPVRATHRCPAKKQGIAASVLHRESKKHNRPMRLQSIISLARQIFSGQPDGRKRCVDM